MTTLALSMKHRALTRQFQEHRRSDGRVQAGLYLPTFSGFSTNGTSVRIGSDPPGGVRQIVVFLTADCPYCGRTLPAWKTLYAEFGAKRPMGTNFVGLTTDSMQVARAYATSNDLQFPLIPFGSEKYVQLFRASVVPQTLVVDPDGRVVFARSGELTSKAAIDSVRMAYTSAQ